MARKPAPAYAPLPGVPRAPSAEELWADGALSMREAAAFTRRSLASMKRLVKAKKVATKKDGKLRLVSKRSCVLYLASLPEN